MLGRLTGGGADREKSVRVTPGETHTPPSREERLHSTGLLSSAPITTGHCQSQAPNATVNYISVGIV